MCGAHTDLFTAVIDPVCAVIRGGGGVIIQEQNVFAIGVRNTTHRVFAALACCKTGKIIKTPCCLASNRIRYVIFHLCLPLWLSR